jgi:hypothetical protein
MLHWRFFARLDGNLHTQRKSRSVTAYQWGGTAPGGLFGARGWQALLSRLSSISDIARCLRSSASPQSSNISPRPTYIQSCTQENVAHTFGRLSAASAVKSCTARFFLCGRVFCTRKSWSSEHERRPGDSVRTLRFAPTGTVGRFSGRDVRSSRMSPRLKASSLLRLSCRTDL